MRLVDLDNRFQSISGQRQKRLRFAKALSSIIVFGFEEVDERSVDTDKLFQPCIWMLLEQRAADPEVPSRLLRPSEGCFHQRNRVMHVGADGGVARHSDVVTQ